MKENGVDIRKVLNDIKKEKKFYDEMVHDKDRKYDKYIELMSMNNKELGGKIEFIFGTSSLIMKYVFDLIIMWKNQKFLKNLKKLMKILKQKKKN